MSGCACPCAALFLFISLSHLCVKQPVCMSVWLSLSGCICLSVCLPVSRYTYLCVSVCAHLSSCVRLCPPLCCVFVCLHECLLTLCWNAYVLSFRHTMQNTDPTFFIIISTKCWWLWKTEPYCKSAGALLAYWYIQHNSEQNGSDCYGISHSWARLIIFVSIKRLATHAVLLEFFTCYPVSRIMDNMQIRI